jgi:hypothetical protein
MKDQVLFFVCTFFCVSAQAQRYFGINGGASKAKIIDLQHHDILYTSNSTLKSGVQFSAYYEAKSRKKYNYRVELQYRHQNFYFKYNQGGHFGSYGQDISYSFHQANLNLIFSRPLLQKKKCSLNVLYGPTLSYKIRGSAIGSTWNVVFEKFVIPSGEVVSYPHRVTTFENNKNTKDLKKVNLGIELGIEFGYQVNDKFGLVFQNRYNYSLNRISLFSGFLNVGVRCTIKD